MAIGDKKTSLEGKVIDLQQEREILAKRLAELDSVLQERVDQIIDVKNDLKAARSESRKISSRTAVSSNCSRLSSRPRTRRAVLPGQVRPVSGRSWPLTKKTFRHRRRRRTGWRQVGQTFSVTRNAQNIATVEVIQTRKEISAADIKTVSSGAKIKIGDTVS